MTFWQEAKDGLGSLRERVWPPVEAPIEPRMLHHPEGAIAVGWYGVATLLILFHRATVEDWWVYCLINLCLITATVLVGQYVIRCASRTGMWLRLSQAVVLILSAFSETGYIIDGISPHGVDDVLIELDRWLFLGNDPTVLLGSLAHPAVVEILQLTYATYYFLPVALGATLIRKDKLRQFELTAAAICLAFYLSYFGYFLVPAVGPRFTIDHAAPLTGLWGFTSIYHVLNSLEPTKKDCFPSGHTLVTLVVLYHAFRYERRVFWWILPLGLGIFVSTVYLRYHYVVDILAAWVLFPIIVWATPRVVDGWHRLTDRVPAPS